MELTNEFTVPVPVERAWEVLNDVELIAPCLPGAQLQEIEGDEYRGVVKVKVGPITAEYKGAATFKEQDVENRRIVLEASGRDTRGQGSASAVITATMTETGGSTHVVVESDVTIKGKVAQFGRGMIAEVSAKLLTQFVECLEGKLEGDAPAAATAPPADATAADAAPTADAASDPDGTTPAPTAAEAGGADATGPAPQQPTVRRIDSQPNEPVDLLGSAGAPVAKRAGPVLAVLIVLLILGRRRSKRRRKG